MNGPAGCGSRPQPAAGDAYRHRIALIAIGAILRFAVAAGSPHGLNVHVVGVVLILPLGDHRRARAAHGSKLLIAFIRPTYPGYIRSSAA